MVAMTLLPSGNANDKSTLPDNDGNDNDNDGNDTGNDAGNNNNNPWPRSGANSPVQCRWQLAEHWPVQRHWQLAQRWTDEMSTESPLALPRSTS